MYNMKIKMKFVQLRAAGIPMYKISDEIGVHRTTLSMWYKELAEYILIAKQDMLDELMYENCCSKLDRVEIISRNLVDLYARLDEPSYKDDTEFGKILDHITKMTKLLHTESYEDGIERSFTNQKFKRINIKSKEVIDDEKAHPFDDEAPIWITDSENFESYQPESDFEEFFGTNKDNAIEVSESDADEIYFPNTILIEPRDISDEDPEVQKIFKRTIRRKAQAKEQEVKTETETKPDKNSSKNGIEESENKIE